MTAGAVIPPTVMPLRLPVPGKPKHVVDTHTPIELRSETPHTEIFYTVDGSKPNPFPWVGCDWRTRRYHHPIFLGEGRKVVKALAVDTTKNRESFVVTKTFFVTKAPKTESMENLHKIDCDNLKTDDQIKQLRGAVQDAVISDTELSVVEEEKLLLCAPNDYDEETGVKNSENDVETAIGNEVVEVTTDIDEVGEDLFDTSNIALAEDPENNNDVLFDMEEEVDNLENMIGEVIAEKVTEVTFGGRFEIQYASEAGSRCQNCQMVMPPSPLCQFCTDCGQSVELEPEYALPSSGQMGKCPDCRSFVPLNIPCCIACEYPFEMSRTAVKVKERKTCRSCCTVNPIEAEMCSMCGKSLSAVCPNIRPHLPKTAPTLHNQCTVITTREFSRCEECGRTNSREARFCDWCGQKLFCSLDLNVECRQCRMENQYFARYCQECGCPLHPPNNEAILAKLQKQHADKAVMAICQMKDQFSQSLDLWKNPDVQSQGVQTSGYYVSGCRGKKNVNKMQNHDSADICIVTPRAVSPGRGFWRQQVEHITKHLKVHAYNDVQFRSNIGQLRLRDLKGTSVVEKENDLNIVLTFALGRDEDYSGSTSAIPSIGGRRVRHIASALIQDTANTANMIEHVPLNSQAAPKPQPRKKSARKKHATSEDVLLTAIQKLEDINVIKAILSKGVNLARCTRNGCSALSLAVQSGHCDAIPLLMQYGAGNFKFPEAQPPLHAAVLLQEAGQPAVEALLRYGADPGVTNRSGQTAYEVATIIDNEYAAKLFSMHLGKVMLSKLMTSNLK